MGGFSNVVADYARTSLVQRAAAESLIKRVTFGGTEDVLDVGCAGGDITAVLRGMTKGRVVGTDIADGMIARARADYPAIEFSCVAAEELTFDAEFDLVFCNSTMQWFRDAPKACRRFSAALRSRGRVVVQATATRNYSPVFLRAMKDVLSDQRTAPIFSSFRPPWFHLDAARAYADLFEAAGFTHVDAEIKRTESRHTVEQAFGVFSTGAMVGYLDPGNYSAGLTDDYVRRFKEIVRSSFRAQADEDGMLTMVFHRIFLSAEKAPL